MRRHDLLTGVLVLIAVLAVATAACTGSASPETAAAPSPSANEAAATSAIPAVDTPTQPVATTATASGRDVEQEFDVTATPVAPELELSARAECVIQLAKEDLAQRVGLALEEIAVVSVQEVQWPDASLGCPQPGETYAEVITPGFQMILLAQGQTYEYRTDRGESVVLCEKAGSSGRPTRGGDTTVDDGWPNQPLGDDVIIVRPTQQKSP